MKRYAICENVAGYTIREHLRDGKCGTRTMPMYGVSCNNCGGVHTVSHNAIDKRKHQKSRFCNKCSNKSKRRPKVYEIDRSTWKDDYGFNAELHRQFASMRL